MLKILMVVGALGLSTLTASADEEYRPMTLNKGIICDTLQQVAEQIDLFSENPQTQVPFVEGCGAISRPVFAMWKPLAPYENEHVVALLAEFHIQGLPTQYSYVAWTAKGGG